MALHPDTISLIKESLPELLVTAEYCINYRKSDGGCLGYPAAMMLFSIVDTIGSFHRRDESFRIRVDGTEKGINGGEYRNFYILNSPYYGQDFSDSIIKKIYDNYRSLLLHNAALPMNHFLAIGSPAGNLVDVIEYIGESFPVVNLSTFLEISRSAVSTFLNNLDDLSKSKQLDDISKKKW